jgi:hypothetical protein
MTKTLNQIIFFFLHQNQNIFFSNIENQNIFLEKNHKWSFPKYSVYFLVATTSGFIQVACSRVQPRTVTIEKKDEINEYKKRKRQKEERTSVPRPLSWNIYVKKQCRHINRAGYNNVCELID